MDTGKVKFKIKITYGIVDIHTQTVIFELNKSIPSPISSSGEYVTLEYQYIDNPLINKYKIVRNNKAELTLVEIDPKTEKSNISLSILSAITGPFSRAFKSMSNMGKSNHRYKKFNNETREHTHTEGGKKTRKSLDDCTVDELKQKAKKRGINVSGLTKSEIIAKLRRK